MNYFGKIFTAAVTFVLCCTNIFAQEQNPADTAASSKPAFPENAPMMRQDGAQKLYYIRDINIHGVQYLNSDILKSSAGLIAGDSIYLPSNFIANAISRLWSQRFFSDVKIGAEIEGDSLDLEVFLKERPRVNNWDFEGISKGKKKDLLEKLKLKRGSELSDYIIDKNKKLIKAYWSEKAFRNTEVDVRITNDTLRPQMVNVTFLIDRKNKVKIGKINFTGNEQFKDKRLRRTFKKTHQKSINIFRGAKLNENDYEEDKDLLIDFYNSRGYRNATIVRDSIYPINDKRLGIDLEVSEGNKYYIRNVSWVGNSVYETNDLQQMFGVSKVVIGVEDNKKNGIEALNKVIAEQKAPVVVESLRCRYPQGGEKQLCQAITGKQVPPGGLPANIGCAVFNINTTIAIYHAIKDGMPVVRKVVTVSGSGVVEPKNLECPIGTPVSLLFDACGGLKDETFKLIAGGPMMGMAQASADFPVAKGTGAVLAFAANENKVSEDPTCIRCGRCVEACPMHLEPLYLYLYVQKNRIEDLEAAHVMDCIECGACSYICPGRLHLTHSFKVGKQKVKEAAAKAKAAAEAAKAAEEAKKEA